MVVHFEENLDPPLCRILVDAGRIGRWREEPYARTTLGLVLSGLTGRDGRIYNTIATVGRRDWLILPNEDVEVTGMSYVVTEVEGTWSAKTLLSREVENKK